jgi:hypothetical protein
MELRQSDYGYDINFTIYENDGTTPVDLTSTDVKFKVVNPDTRIVIVNGDCDIVSASSGTCTYTVADGDFSKYGNFVGGLVLTTSSSVITTRDIYITVKKKIS